MADEKTTDAPHDLPAFDFVPDPIKVVLLVPMPQPNGQVRYRNATEDDLAEVFLSLGDDGRQRVGHLMLAKMQKDKEAGSGKENASTD